MRRLFVFALIVVALASAGCCGGGIELPSYEASVRTPGLGLRQVPSVQPTGWGVAMPVQRTVMVPLQAPVEAPCYAPQAPAAPCVPYQAAPQGYTPYGYGYAAPPAVGAPVGAPCP